MTVRHKSLRVFLAISRLFELLVKQINIVEAYSESLIGDNELSIFMRLPPGMRDFF